jgi:uncharacterized protein
MNLCLGTPLNAWISWKNRKAFSLKSTLPMAACILCGVIPGTLLLKYATSWVLKACLGILILIIGIEMITRDRAKPIRYNPVLMAVISFCSGVTAGLYGINLFFVAYVERTTTNREEFRGRVCFIFLIENIFRIITYIIAGVFTRDVLMLIAIAAPGMLLGFIAGTKIDKRLSEKTIRKIITCMFMLGGFSVLIKAILFKA